MSSGCRPTSSQGGSGTLVIMSASAADHVYAIIPAGGVGSRLWPLSRAKEPKFLLDLTGSGHSLLRSTWDRIVPLIGSDHIMVVTGAAHRASVVSQLPDLDGDNLVLESEPRDSTAAICLAAALIARRDPDAIVASFPADHFIGDERAFREVVTEAAQVAATGRLVTIGITPTSPSTGFGYIRTDGILDPDGSLGLPKSARAVTSFVEKPKASVAREYVASGEYLWNAGMFVARAVDLMCWLRESQPELAAGIDRIADAWGTPAVYEEKAKTWPKLKKIAIDYAIAEPVAAAGQVAVIPGDFDWDDVGDFSAVARQVRKRNPGNLAILGEASVLSESSTGVLVSETDRLIAIIGVQDLVVVDTEDVLMITTSDHAQRVKEMVNMVRQTGNENLL